MYDKSLFNRSQFNLSGADAASFYVTIQSDYDLAVPPAKVLVRIDSVEMNTIATAGIERLWLYAPIAAATFAAEYGTAANMTALVPLGQVSFDAETDVSVVLRAQMPLGDVTFATEMNTSLQLWVMVPISATTVKTEQAMTAQLGMKVPLSPLMSELQFDLQGMLYTKVPMPDTTIHSEFGTSCKVIRTSESEEMVLEGLSLKPGQRLIIDTDTLEIMVNDEIRVDCWVTGGTFFQLENGSNTLTFTDNAKRRYLQATVLWADRYL